MQDRDFYAGVARLAEGTRKALIELGGGPRGDLLADIATEARRRLLETDKRIAEELKGLPCDRGCGREAVTLERITSGANAPQANVCNDERCKDNKHGGCDHVTVTVKTNPPRQGERECVECGKRWPPEGPALDQAQAIRFPQSLEPDPGPWKPMPGLTRNAELTHYLRGDHDHFVSGIGACGNMVARPGQWAKTAPEATCASCKRTGTVTFDAHVEGEAHHFQIENVFSAHAGADGITVANLEDRYNDPRATLASGRSKDRALKLALSVWEKVRAAKHYAEACRALEDAGVKFTHYCAP